MNRIKLLFEEKLFFIFLKSKILVFIEILLNHFLKNWAQKVDPKSQEILKSAGYLERSYIQQETNSTSREGNEEGDSAAEQEQ
jgi:hypothetical protein